MGWLAHQFAKATQTGVFFAATLLLSATGGSMWSYDALNETVDDIAGPKRDAIVQVFEGEIETLKSIQEQYGQIVADQSTAFIGGNEAEINALEQKATLIEDKMDATSDRIEREIHLVPAISEQDFVMLAEKYNANFTLGRRSINVEDAEYLHDAQQKENMVNITRTERTEMSENIQNTMSSFEKSERYGFFVFMGGVISMVMGVWGMCVVVDSETVKRIASEPTPKSPFTNWQEGKARRREKKIQQRNKMN